jgi:hypothetical protein
MALGGDDAFLGGRLIVKRDCELEFRKVPTTKRGGRLGGRRVAALALSPSLVIVFVG